MAGCYKPDTWNIVYVHWLPTGGVILRQNRAELVKRHLVVDIVCVCHGQSGD